VLVVLREGYVSEEFIALARKEERSAEEESHLTVLKQQLADRLLASPAADVYDVAEG